MSANACITNESVITAASTMREILQAFPGAQRTLFRQFHVGGCSSCAFQSAETLDEVCRRNSLAVDQVLAALQSSQEHDEKILISPTDLAALRETNPALKLLDVRSRQEFEAVHIHGSVLMTQPTMRDIMSYWPREEGFVIVDHHGTMGLDAAAYFIGHGFTNVRCLRGGIDAWSLEVDRSVPRYRLS